MSLRFIYGKSGTGKTYYCFEAIQQFIQNHQKVYMITPEQFSFTAEKHLMQMSKKKAMLSAEVITFERMAYRIVSEVGEVPTQAIQDYGKAMLLASMIQKQKQNLNFLGKTDKNLSLILSIITELKKNNVSPSLLEKTEKTLDDPLLQMKMQDIHVLYHNFQKVIQNNYLDQDDVLTLVKEKIKESELFQDAYIYIDEFSGFTKQEYAFIEEIMQVAKEVNITMCCDSLEKSNFPENDIYAPNKKTISKLKEIANNHHIPILEPVHLTNVYRYHSAELQYLSDALYAVKPKPYLKNCEDIHLFLASNADAEIEYVAKQISQLVREEGYAYQDIAIITKEIEEYASLLRTIFGKYAIPVFIDEKKEWNQNILVKYLLSILEVFAKSFRLEEVMQYLKTGLAEDITPDEIYRFENYCKKSGITGFRKFSTEWNIELENNEDLQALNELRKKVIEPLMVLKEKLGTNKTVKEITSSLYAFLEQNNIKEKLIYKMNQLREMGNIDLANVYETSWDLFASILDELVMLLGEEKIGFDGYMQLLKVGFQNSSLGKIPATLDEVMVGDVDRTRSGDKKIIFIIGLNDGKFPTVHKNEGFVSDEEREYLKTKGIELAKTTAEQLYDENFNIHKAFSIAEEKLFLSYVAADNEGKGLRKSILIYQLKKIFPFLEEKSDILEHQTFIGTKDVTFDTLIIKLAQAMHGETIEPIWWEIYSIFSKDEHYQARLNQAIQGLNDQTVGEKIDHELLEKIYGDTLRTSISQLESYERCPFSYYLKYGLKLSDQTELKLEKIDTGTLMHDVIHDFFDMVQEQNKSIKEITNKEIEEMVEQILQYKLQLKHHYKFQSIPKYIVLTKRLKKVMVRSLQYIIQSLQASDFSVLGTEIEFKENKTYPPIQIDLDNGKKVEIIGKIDRVDIAENKQGKFIRIIDYKSSVKNIDFNEVVAGIQIQLLTYLDVVTKKEAADAAGMLYFNLMEPVMKMKNKHFTEEELEQEIRSSFRMNGYILGNVEVVKMMDNHFKTGNSNIIPAYIDKEGNLSNSRSSVLQKEEFAILQKKVNQIIKQIAETIMDGNIKQNPIYLLKNKRTACEFCHYQTICGFHPKMCHHPYRYIPNLSKNEILNHLKGEKDV